MVVKRVVLNVVGVSNSCSFGHVLITIGTISFILCQNYIYICNWHVVFGEGIAFLSTW